MAHITPTHPPVALPVIRVLSVSYYLLVALLSQANFPRLYSIYVHPLIEAGYVGSANGALKWIQILKIIFSNPSGIRKELHESEKSPTLAQ